MYLPFEQIRTGDEYHDIDGNRIVKISPVYLMDKRTVNVVFLSGIHKGKVSFENRDAACQVPDDYNGDVECVKNQ